jgi:hypothetical protein
MLNLYEILKYLPEKWGYIKFYCTLAVKFIVCNS